jgi:hypothetical protein
LKQKWLYICPFQAKFVSYAMPKDNTWDCLVEPKRLKVPLMPHQRLAVTWGLWCETQNPPSGILGA